MVMEGWSVGWGGEVFLGVLMWVGEGLEKFCAFSAFELRLDLRIMKERRNERVGKLGDILMVNCGGEIWLLEGEQVKNNLWDESESSNLDHFSNPPTGFQFGLVVNSSIPILLINKHIMGFNGGVIGPAEPELAINMKKWE